MGFFGVGGGTKSDLAIRGEKMELKTLKTEAKTLALLANEARICSTEGGYYGTLLAILDRRAIRLVRLLNEAIPDQAGRIG